MKNLDNHQTLRAFLESQNEGSYYVGHASVLLRVEGKTYLIDGVLPRPLFLDSWLFYPELAIDDSLFQVDGVFISHCHEDHYDLNFLRKLKKGTPIYITKGRIGFEELQKDKTFNVVEIEPFQKFPIAENIYCVALPSDHNNFDSSFIIKGRTFSLFQGNDNFLDKASMQKARDLSGPVDHAYVPYSYVWWYPFCLKSMEESHRKSEITRLTRLNMEIGAMMSQVLDAKVIIPSAGNLVFFDLNQSSINREIALPFDFIDFIKENHPQLSNRAYPLLSGDYVLKTQQTHQVISRNRDRKDFLENLDLFLQNFEEIKPVVDSFRKLEEKHVQIFKNKFKGKDLPTFDMDLYFALKNDQKNCLHINLRNYEVNLLQKEIGDPNSITFLVDSVAFKMWLDSEVNFETILNSQRFSIYRYPEVFDRKLWDVVRSHF